MRRAYAAGLSARRGRSGAVVVVGSSWVSGEEEGGVRSLFYTIILLTAGKGKKRGRSATAVSDSRPGLLFFTHAPARTHPLHTPHILTAPPRVPTWRPRHPLPSNVAQKIPRFRSKRAPGRRANQADPAVAGRRLASRRAVRPSRAALATVAASRGPSGARRSSRSGEPPRFGAGARGGVRNRPSRRAVPTSFGWPCAHGLTAPPPRGTPRGPR